MGIQIPKPLSDGASVTKITEIDVGEVYSFIISLITHVN